MFDWKLLKKLDSTLFITTLFLICSGFLLIYSATQGGGGEGKDAYFFLRRQMLWFIIGLVGMFFFIYRDYASFQPLSKGIYLFNLLLLLLVLFIGKGPAGTRRWISLGIFPFQPSEFAKLFVIITLASYLAEKKESIEKPFTLLISFLHIVLPLLLIFKQPDLGTSLIFLVIWLGMVFMAGAKPKHLLGFMGGALALSPFLWMLLKDYQKRRLLIFLDPDIDPLGAGYHLIQSKIAIGSGQLFGKGLFAGTQSQLRFIPGQHTDFIFALLGEEFGFVGAVFLLSLYSIFIWRALHTASVSKDSFGSLMAVGIASMLAFHLFINIGMAVGIMPITGIPLPFISYGGSSLITNMLATALLLNIYMRRQRIRF